MIYLEGTAPCDVLVRPIAVPAVIQVLSRYWALWGIVEVAPEAVKNGALKLFTVGDVTLQLNIITLLFCWSATEILRYGFYAAKVGMLHLPMPSRHRQTHHVTSADTCFVHLAPSLQCLTEHQQSSRLASCMAQHLRCCVNQAE